MIEFERTKKIAKNKKMSLREANDKAELGTKALKSGKVTRV